MVYAIDGKAGIDFTKTGSTPLYTLGTVVKTNDGEYTYVKHPLAAAAIGDVYKVQEDYVTVAVDTTESGSEPTNLGAAQVVIAAGTSTAQYAWLFTGFGNFLASVATTISAGAALTTTASAKVLGAGGDAVGAAAVGNTSGGAAVIACFAPGKLATNA
jgi:hypothetical protein